MLQNLEDSCKQKFSKPMTLRDIIYKLLRRQPASASTARERLQLVLAHDRSDLSTELLDQMRKEILEVVAKYVEIDMDEGAVSLETEDRMTALVANLPIKRTFNGQIKLIEPTNQLEEISQVKEDGKDQHS